MITTSVRLPEDLAREIEKAAKEEKVDKGAILRRFADAGLREYKLEKALDKYRQGRVSLWKAAGLAGISYREALEEARKRNIPFQYREEDLERDIEWAVRE
jgi:predicted HTH domain antitoxin